LAAAESRERSKPVGGAIIGDTPIFLDEARLRGTHSNPEIEREEYKVPGLKGYCYQPTQRVGAFPFSGKGKFDSTNEFLFSGSKKSLFPRASEWKTGSDNWNGFQSCDVAPELVN